ncbi:MAG TPA: AsmA-like C-terminal region-containing protein, partial [Devosia sp.]|nr:AsmA-like C-terminal region-containing protein [Devosia sp.]
SSYTALPDENRSATRLTGAVELKLGQGLAFNAVISGGVIALPPRDATTELTDPPYELVRLLGETPLPPIPDIAGTVGLDISELNLRAVSLRDLRLDAATDGKSWAIKDFSGTLPGGTKVGLSGALSADNGHPTFVGALKLDTDRLDMLAQLWRKPSADNPLYNLAGSLSADVALSGDTLALSSGKLVIDGVNQGFDAAIGFAQTRQLKLDAHLTTVGAEESAAIIALLPDVSAGGAFGATFPKGEIDVAADKAELFGLDGTDLAAAATWDGGVLEFSKLSAGDLGGLSIDAKLTAFGTLAKPELSGSAAVKLASAAPAFSAAMAALNTPRPVADFLERSLPADVNVSLDAPAGDGGQTLSVTGKLGAATTTLSSKLTAGVVNALVAPITASLDLKSQSALLLTRQLGLGDTPLFGSDKTPLHVALSLEGAPSNSYQTHLRLESGDDHLAFDGDVIPGDFSKIAGTGNIEARIADPSPLLATLGAGGLYLPAVAGTARLAFDGLGGAELAAIDASGVSGDLAMSRQDSTTQVSGTLALPAIDTQGLLPLLVGAAGTVPGSGLWPDGPIDIGSGARRSTGRIDLTAASISAGGKPLLGKSSFGFDWDDKSVHLRDLSGPLSSGTLTLDATVCCSTGSLPVKEVSGRVALAGAAVAAIAPPAVAADIKGAVDATAAFDGTGASLADAVAAMTGTGSYTINGFSAKGLDPGIFDAAGKLTGVAEMAPDLLSNTLADKLAGAPFTAPQVTGSFTIAGGVLRNPNLEIVGAGSRIFGSASLGLADLALDARYTLSPTGTPDPSNAVDPATAEVTAAAKGPLWAPVGSYDVSALADGMKIKANELELAVLEQRKAEADARAKAEADAAARLAILAPGEAIATAGAARKAADDETARKAADDAAKQKAATAIAASNDLGL